MNPNIEIDGHRPAGRKEIYRPKVGHLDGPNNWGDHKFDIQDNGNKSNTNRNYHEIIVESLFIYLLGLLNEWADYDSFL